MRKLIYLTIFALISIVSFAQTNPNRMVLYPKEGDMQGFLVERLDSIKFHKVEGCVAADLELVRIDMEKPMFVIKVTRTEKCVAFQVAYLPSTIANRLSDAGLVNYVNTNEPTFYSQDFTAGELTGTTAIEHDTEYTIVTVGYDEFRTPCTVCRVTATTPKKPLVGNPSVEISVTDTQARSFTVHFTPNSDVKEYYLLAMEPDLFEQQYQMFAPMFGFKNHGDMVKAWGARMDSEGDYTWPEMKPNTLYRIYVQALDAADTYAEIQTADLTTAKLGGSGDAYVNITLGDYKLEEWPDESGNLHDAPSQYITFAPNDQTSRFRVLVYDKKTYEDYKDDIKSSMLEEEGNYDFYEVYTDAYQVQANSDYYAIAVAQNADGVWGEYNEFAFTTGDTPSKVIVAPGKVSSRNMPKAEPYFSQGKGFKSVKANGKGQFSLSE